MAYTSTAESRVENSAQVSSCYLKFVHGSIESYICEKSTPVKRLANSTLVGSKASFSQKVL
jgi:hypothetical protein